jgi:hypothetical protein
MNADLPLCPAGFSLSLPIEKHPVCWRARGCCLAGALAILLALLGSASTLQAAYTPYYSDFFAGTLIDTTKWYQNGSLYGSGGMAGYGLFGDGSLISKVTPPAPSTDYQVETGLQIEGTSSNV